MLGFYHYPTYRIFKTKAEVEYFMNNEYVDRWNPTYKGNYDTIWNESMLANVERKRKLMEKVELLEEDEKPLVSEKKNWTKARDEYVSKKVSEICKTIDDNKSTINKLQKANSILLKSIEHYEIQYRREYEQLHPFPKERILKNLRNKISRIRCKV